MSQPAELDVTQANLVLPIELIEQILHECLALRQRRQNDLDFDPERWYRSGEEEIILPLIQSCRLFAHIIIPKLYRHVKLNSQFSIERFLEFTQLDSFQLVRIMHVAKLPDEVMSSEGTSHWYKNLLPGILEYRLLQSHLNTPRDFLTLYPNLMSGVHGTSHMGQYLRDWQISRRPRLEHLEVHGDLFNWLLPSLVKLFSVDQLVMNGFHMGYGQYSLNKVYELHADLAGLEVDGDITLHCDLSFDFYFREIPIPAGITKLTPRSVTVTLGWWQDGEADPADADGTKIFLDRILNYIKWDEVVSNRDIFLKPYVRHDRPDGHAYSLPGAIEPVITKSWQSNVYFQSDCDCGNGKKTGFWDTAREDVLECIRDWYGSDSSDDDA